MDAVDGAAKAPSLPTRIEDHRIPKRLSLGSLSTIKEDEVSSPPRLRGAYVYNWPTLIVPTGRSTAPGNLHCSFLHCGNVIRCGRLQMQLRVVR